MSSFSIAQQKRSSKSENLMRDFNNAIQVIRESYYVEQNFDSIVKQNFKLFLKNLDPYCAYLDGEDLAAFNRRKTGNYIEIGINLMSRKIDVRIQPHSRRPDLLQ